MGFAFIDRYDVDACAELCNTRGPDGSGGACQYFNIWRALVNGIPTTYTCSFVSRKIHINRSVLTPVYTSTTSFLTNPPPITSVREISRSLIHAGISVKR